MLSFISESASTSDVAWVAFACMVLYSIFYIVYQRFFHPLAEIPGPFLASLTDLCNQNSMYELHVRHTLTSYIHL